MERELFQHLNLQFEFSRVFSYGIQVFNYTNRALENICAVQNAKFSVI
jgi:hypothetical protein